MNDTVFKPLGDTWRSYLDAAFAQRAPALQVVEVRRAYYCGAHALLLLLEHTADLPDPDKAVVMRAIKAELSLFNATLGTSLEGRI